MECSCCFDDMNELVRYRDWKEGEQKEWKVSPYCEKCIKYMLNVQFKNYVNEVKNQTCKVSLERLIRMGPPKRFRDSKVPCENDDGEVYEFSFGSSTLLYTEEEMEEANQLIEMLKCKQ